MNRQIEWETHIPTRHASAYLPARLVLRAYPSRLIPGEYVAWAHMDGGSVLRDDSVKGTLDQAKERAVELGREILRSRQAEITAAFEAIVLLRPEGTQQLTAQGASPGNNPATTANPSPEGAEHP